MSRSVIRLGYVLLAVMTLVSFGGPFLIVGVLKGGEGTTWPPDRPLEWAVIIGITAVVIGILIGLSLLWVANVKHLKATKPLLKAAREAQIQAAAEAERGAL